MTVLDNISPASRSWPKVFMKLGSRKGTVRRPRATIKIVKLVNEAIDKTREVCQGGFRVVSDSQGLMSALQLWAAETENLFGISCRFQCESPVLIHYDSVAAH